MPAHRWAVLFARRRRCSTMVARQGAASCGSTRRREDGEKRSDRVSYSGPKCQTECWNLKPDRLGWGLVGGRTIIGGQCAGAKANGGGFFGDGARGGGTGMTPIDSTVSVGCVVVLGG